MFFFFFASFVNVFNEPFTGISRQSTRIESKNYIRIVPTSVGWGDVLFGTRRTGGCRSSLEKKITDDKFPKYYTLTRPVFECNFYFFLLFNLLFPTFPSDFRSLFDDVLLSKTHTHTRSYARTDKFREKQGLSLYLSNGNTFGSFYTRPAAEYGFCILLRTNCADITAIVQKKNSGRNAGKLITEINTRRDKTRIVSPLPPREMYIIVNNAMYTNQTDKKKGYTFLKTSGKLRLCYFNASAGPDQSWRGEGYINKANIIIIFGRFIDTKTNIFLTNIISVVFTPTVLCCLDVFVCVCVRS